jgi:hypothetical protein
MTGDYNEMDGSQIGARNPADVKSAMMALRDSFSSSKVNLRVLR